MAQTCCSHPSPGEHHPIRSTIGGGPLAGEESCPIEPNLPSAARATLPNKIVFGPTRTQLWSPKKKKMSRFGLNTALAELLRCNPDCAKRAKRRGKSATPLGDMSSLVVQFFPRWQGTGHRELLIFFGDWTATITTERRRRIASNCHLGCQRVPG